MYTKGAGLGNYDIFEGYFKLLASAHKFLITDKFLAIIDDKNVLNIKYHPIYSGNQFIHILENVKEITGDNSVVFMLDHKNNMFFLGDGDHVGKDFYREHVWTTFITNNVTKISLNEECIIEKDQLLYFLTDNKLIDIDAKTCLFHPLNNLLYIDKKDKLYIINLGDNKEKLMASDIKQVYTHNQKIYWIDNDNILWVKNESFPATALYRNVLKISCNENFILILTINRDLYYVGNFLDIFTNVPSLISTNVYDVKCCSKQSFAVIQKIL